MALYRHIPNTITSMNLLCGAMGVIYSMQGRMKMAFIFMLLAAVFDFCDGLAARMLKAYSPIGKELDSLCDMVSFGLLPSLMLVATMHYQGCTGWVIYLPLFLAVMSALRLAKFNIDERQTSDFLGVPTPAAAIICGSLAAYIRFEPESLLATWAGTPWFLPAVAVILGLLLVSEIPMFGMKVAKGHRLLDAKRIVFLVASVVVLVVTLIVNARFCLAVLAVFSVYIVENLVCALINSFRRGA